MSRYDLPTEVLPFKVKHSTLARNDATRFALEHTDVVRFPNNHGFALVYNLRGDAQLVRLKWSSYRINAVEAVGDPIVTTHDKMPALVKDMAYQLAPLAMSEQEKRAARLDLTALIQIGQEEHSESYASHARSDSDFKLMPRDPSPSLDWAVASLSTLTAEEQNQVMGPLLGTSTAALVYNMLCNINLISTRISIEQGRYTEALHWMEHGPARDTCLEMTSPLLAAANADFVQGTHLTRELVSAIFRRKDHVPLEQLLAYFNNAKHGIEPKVACIINALEKERESHRSAKSHFSVDETSWTMQPRRQSAASHSLFANVYSRMSHEDPGPEVIARRAYEAIPVTQLVSQLVQGYGKQGPEIQPEPPAGGYPSQNAEVYARILPQMTALRKSCNYLISLGKLDESITLLDHVNDIGSTMLDIPAMTMAVLNSHVNMLLSPTSMSLEQKIRWYIDHAVPVFKEGSAGHVTAKNLVGDLSTWSTELTAATIANLRTTAKATLQVDDELPNTGTGY